MSYIDVKEARRTSAIKKRGLIAMRDRAIREARDYYRAKGFTRAQYLQEVREAQDHYRSELAIDQQHLRDAISELRR
ncbi:MAG: hypothetical protein KG012_14175 [Deltaproteobacteria bacterium]|nr:hypothetical protein [Deltaproteobacteria bacterium]